ncbi:MAG: EAL domain-containing protein [Parasulfuritortus sp.]|nr:EAL domain-containing protein [Parasulfuritortus sp.]
MPHYSPCGHALDPDSPSPFASRDIWPRILDLLQRGETESAKRVLEDCIELNRILANTAPDWEYWLAPDNRYIYVSPSCATLTGYTADEFLADADLMRQIVHPDDLETYSNHHHAALEHALLDQEMLDFRIVTKSGEVRWITHVCCAIHRADGTYLGQRGVNRDSTQRKSAELALQRITRMYATLSDSNQCIVRSSDEANLFADICRIAVQVGGLKGCVVSMLDPALGVVHPAAYQGLDTACIANMEASLLGPEKISPTSLSIRDGVRYICNDIGADPETCGWKATAELAGIGSCASYPLLRGNRPVGAVSFYAGEPDYFSPDIAQLLDEMAMDLSFALDNFERERQRLESLEKLRQTARVFESTAEGVMITDNQTRILAVNRAFTRLTGFEEAEVLGHTPALLHSGQQDPAFYQVMWQGLTKTGMWQGEIWNRRKNGEIYPEWLTISSIKNDAGLTTHYVGVFSDISNVKRAQEAQEFLAYHDPLTGLPNRSLLRARLEHSIQQADRDKRSSAVLFLDLDRFKDINDSLGHTVGDELLRLVAGKMSKLVRIGDTLARLGGDEFVILVEDSAAPEQAATVASKLLALFDEPIMVGSSEIFVTASIGISLFPDDGADVDTLIRNADLAMYQAKAKGRNTYQFYEAEMTRHILERTGLENALRGALGRKEFMLFYQPQVDIETGALLGVEALIRWRHPEFGLVSPARFIPAAEEIGLIGEIGAWVLHEACRQAMDWKNTDLDVPCISVNLSVRQLEREPLLELVARILNDTGLTSDNLELEVTESMIMRQTDNAISVLNGLRDMGIRLAVDDFGTGYSSLSYLKRLPLNRLKIDQSFVRDLAMDDNDLAIVRAIIALGKSLGLDVVAEGVEDRDQAAFLQREGCRVAQGYLYGHPVNADELHRIWSRKS